MKRCLGLLPSLLILAVLLLFCLWTGRRVGTDTERWRAPLIQSSEAALLGDWDAAGDLLHPAHVASAGDIGGRGVSLDVHKNGAQHHDSHKNVLLRLYFLHYTAWGPFGQALSAHLS